MFYIIEHIQKSYKISKKNIQNLKKLHMYCKIEWRFLKTVTFTPDEK